jgi:hypothetical protein
MESLDIIIDADGISRFTNFNNNDGFGGFSAAPQWTLQSHSVYRTLDRFIYIVETWKIRKANGYMMEKGSWQVCSHTGRIDPLEFPELVFHVMSKSDF